MVFQLCSLPRRNQTNFHADEFLAQQSRTANKPPVIAVPRKRFFAWTGCVSEGGER